MARTSCCTRHRHALLTGIHPATSTWTVALVGSAVTVFLTLAVASGTQATAALFLGGLAVTGWASLQTLHAHSDGDDVQKARRDRVCKGARR